MECIHQEGQRELDTVAVQAAAEEVRLESLVESGFEKFKPVVIQMKHDEVYLEDLVFMDSVAISKCNLKKLSLRRETVGRIMKKVMYTCNFCGWNMCGLCKTCNFIATFAGPPNPQWLSGANKGPMVPHGELFNPVLYVTFCMNNEFCLLNLLGLS